MDEKITQVLERALLGEKEALEDIVLQIKEPIYNLSLKMLLYPEDAQDATQEILIKVITHLSTFRKESAFRTWVYRIAKNYLLTEKTKKNRLAKFISFDEYAVQIDKGQSHEIIYTKNRGEIDLLEEEVKISCTHGLLHCLTPTDRLIYILGDILEFNSIEAAEILEITSSNFRKRLSRSREKMKNFLEAKCGLVSERNPCRCKRKVDFLIDQDMIQPSKLRFAHQTSRSIDLIAKIDTLGRTLDVFQSVPVLKAPDEVLAQVRKTIHATSF